MDNNIKIILRNCCNKYLITITKHNIVNNYETDYYRSCCVYKITQHDFLEVKETLFYDRNNNIVEIGKQLLSDSCNVCIMSGDNFYATRIENIYMLYVLEEKK